MILITSFDPLVPTPHQAPDKPHPFPQHQVVSGFRSHRVLYQAKEVGLSRGALHSEFWRVGEGILSEFLNAVDVRSPGIQRMGYGGMPAGAIKYPHRATQVGHCKLESLFGAGGMGFNPGLPVSVHLG